MKIEQVGVARGGRSHCAGPNETDDAGSNPVGGRWCIGRGGRRRSYITVSGLKGNRNWDGRENWLVGVRLRVIENGE